MIAQVVQIWRGNRGNEQSSFWQVQVTDDAYKKVHEMRNYPDRKSAFAECTRLNHMYHPEWYTDEKPVAVIVQMTLSL